MSCVTSRVTPLPDVVSTHSGALVAFETSVKGFANDRVLWSCLQDCQQSDGMD